MPQGKLALTRFEVVKTNPATSRALIRCRLHTGRTHQVRIHLSHLGTPVIGDKVYGKSSFARLALHAQTLGFYHPRYASPMLFSLSLPTDLKNLLR